MHYFEWTNVCHSTFAKDHPDHPRRSESEREKKRGANGEPGFWWKYRGLGLFCALHMRKIKIYYRRNVLVWIYFFLFLSRVVVAAVAVVVARCCCCCSILWELSPDVFQLTVSACFIFNGMFEYNRQTYFEYKLNKLKKPTRKCETERHKSWFSFKLNTVFGR